MVFARVRSMNQLLVESEPSSQFATTRTRSDVGKIKVHDCNSCCCYNTAHIS